MNLILIEHADGRVRTAFLKDGRLFRYEEEDGTHPKAEEIYYCRTDRCMPGMECVFVRLDERTNAYLPYREMRGTPVPPRSGTGLIVQIRRSPVSGKLAYASMDVSLCGKYVLLLPCSERCSVSQRMPEDLKPAALERARRLRMDGFGIVLRSESPEASDDLIMDEMRSLAARWDCLKQKAGGEPRLLEGRLPAYVRFYRDAKDGVDRVVTDAPVPGLDGVPTEIRENPMACHAVDAQREKGMRRLVRLPGGGSLVIDPCEAMTVIDVNSAMDTGSRRGAEASRTRVNLEAADEIARLLQLRSIGGIVLIDFIDMDRPENREAVEDALRRALETDPCKTVLHGFTSLGLMEMTRKKS